MKLNLGCFDKKLPGFVNVDIRQDVDPDMVDDAFRLERFEDNSADEIYSSHMLEHLSRKDGKQAIQRWFQVLKPGGVLRLAVPDIEAAMRRYLYTGNLSELDCLIFGSQKHQFDFHYAGYDFSTLSSLLRSEGFEDVKRWNWWEETPYRYIDDFSHAYLPSDKPDIALSHGRVIKQGGLLVSLNVEGTKPNV